MDEMTVNVEALPDHADNAERAGAAAELAKRIKQVVGVSVRVNVTEPGGVARSQGKAVRIVDNRPKDG